jgi:hypothetical protein
MAIGAKVNETRGRRMEYRGDLCIHAGKANSSFSAELAEATLADFHKRGLRLRPGTQGCILAVVELWDVQPAEHFATGRGWFERDLIPLTAEELLFGDYRDGRQVYRTRRLRRLQTPVPCRGAQALGWPLPPDVEAAVRAQLAEGEGEAGFSHIRLTQ